MKGFFLREEKSIEGCSFTLTLKPTKTCDFHYQAVASFVDNKLTVTPLDHFDFISFTMEFTEEGILEVSEHYLPTVVHMCTTCLTLDWDGCWRHSYKILQKIVICFF